MTRLYRSEEDRMIGGVCGGIAEIYDLDPSLVRLVTLLLILSSGAPVILYLAAWLIIPPKSEVEDQLDEEEASEDSGDSEEEPSEQEQESDEESEEDSEE
jgi:phage shock protein C